MNLSVDDVVLRRCTVDDASRLAVVGAATFLEAFAGRLDGDAIIAHCLKNHTADAYRHYLEDSQGEAWIAETMVGGAPVGYLLLTSPDLPLPDITANDLELKRIYLFSRFHGGGVGQHLMQRAVLSAQERNMKRLLLGVHRENARALAFYGRNAFVPIGVRTFQVGNVVYDDLVLGREL